MEESEEFQARFLNFFEDIIRHDLPNGIPFDKDGKLKTECLPRPPDRDAELDKIQDFLPCFEEDVKYCGELLQHHSHQDVCFKYGHATCQFVFPHEYIANSYYDKEMQSVVLDC